MGAGYVWVQESKSGKGPWGVPSLKMKIVKRGTHKLGLMTKQTNKKRGGEKNNITRWEHTEGNKRS